MYGKDFGEIYIYGDISMESWTEQDMTPEKFRDLINQISDKKEVRIHINSVGGSALAGFDIINLIDNFKKNVGAKVVIYIDGLAAGIAGAIAMAGNKIYMDKNAVFMICKSFMFAVKKAEIENQRETLKKFDDLLVENYMRRFNRTEKELIQLMKYETWFNAEEAMEYGFVDEIITESVKRPKGESNES